MRSKHANLARRGSSSQVLKRPNNFDNNNYYVKKRAQVAPITLFLTLSLSLSLTNSRVASVAEH